MNLYIDLGNTRLKWATGNNFNTLIPGEAVVNRLLTCDKLIELWQNIDKPEKIAVARVGGNDIYQIIASAANSLWPEIELISAFSQAKAFGVTNAYAVPGKLGIDRWLSIVAAFHKYRKNFCLVGCGTAITLDVVDNEGTHLGGLICPGINLMRSALANNTANLTMNLNSYSFGLADNTDAAIHNGTLAAACGLIEKLLKNQADQLPLILSGGDASVIAGIISSPAVIEPNLVLEGLALTLNAS